MPKKRRQGNPQNQQQKKYHGISKKHHQPKGHWNERTKFISPHLIHDQYDEDLDRRDDKNNRQYNNNKNNYSRKEKSSRKFLEKLTVNVKDRKLAIGDEDAGPKKILVPSKPHCQLTNVPDGVFNVIVTFLQNYFNCYDTNRDGLLGAYNPKVLFSLSINASNSNAFRVFKFDDYLKESRNLKRVFASDDYYLEKRFKLLHEGHIDTVNFLRKLPPSEHESGSFKLDHCFFMPNMITFSVVGAFKEGKATDKVRPLRSFQRTFVCIPDANTGMSIINESYTIASCSTQQYKTYYKDKLNSTTSSDPTSSVEIPNLSQLHLNELTSNLTEQQIQFINQFSTHTNLNFKWSHDCLQQSGWNYEAAGQMFIEYKSKIPADAYLTKY